MRSSISCTFRSLEWQRPNWNVMPVKPSSNCSTRLRGMCRAYRQRARMLAMVRRSSGFLTGMPIPSALPSWLNAADVDFYADEFARTGFRGGLNWYRNIDRNWELTAPFAGAQVAVPALYMAGDRDLVVAFRGMDKVIGNLQQLVPQLHSTLMLQGCGHWTQQERPAEVNTAMIDFLRRL